MFYLISISLFFLWSGKILSQAIVKRPSLSSAPFTFTSSAIVNDLANCLCEIPLWIISPSSFLSSDLLNCLVNDIGNEVLIYKTKKYGVPCERRFEVNASGTIIAFSSSGCF